MTDDELLNTVPRREYDWREARNRVLDSIDHAKAVHDWESKYMPSEPSYSAIGNIIDILPAIIHYDEHPDFVSWPTTIKNATSAIKEMVPEIVESYIESPLEGVYDAATGAIAGAGELVWPTNMPILTVPSAPFEEEDSSYDMRMPEFPVRAILRDTWKSLMHSKDKQVKDMQANPEDYAE
jgi:hypothetical protein